MNLYHWRRIKIGCISKLNNYNIEFDKVAFSYNDNNHVLNNVSFKIPQGSKIAIVGSNGSGKTTILNLLL